MTFDLDAARAQARSVLAKMTLREKIGQMTQAEKNSVTPDDVRDHALGSVLSGGGGNPEPNDPAHWKAMVSGFLDAARQSRLGVPLLYGSDAVHGHNNVRGATIFPHNVGLGAVGDEDLVRDVAEATALEVAATGVRWTFAPAVSIPFDVRWGRTYEGYGQNTDLVTRLARAYVQGVVGNDPASPTSLLPSVKHFLADGSTAFGSSTRIDRSTYDPDLLRNDRTLANATTIEDDMVRRVRRGAWTLDQGDVEMSDDDLHATVVPPYRSAIEAGALNVMASYSRLNGVRMHANTSMLRGLLKTDLGFEGFVVSDWEAIQQLDADFDACIVAAIGAGVDMIMVPFEWRRFIDATERLVDGGAIPAAWIDEAALRILTVKAVMGLFDTADAAGRPDLAVVGCAEHRALARTAAARSQTLLRNEQGVLPLARDAGGPVLVVGAAAHDVGLQCGGWTVSWMGAAGPTTLGSTLLDGLREHLDEGRGLMVDLEGRGDARAEVGIVVVAEEPYAEGMGDRFDLDLSEDEVATVMRVRARVDRLIVVVYSGRPVVLGAVADVADAIVAAWLPGSEGAGVADPLCGVTSYEARTTYRWPRASADLPLHTFDRGYDPDSDWQAAWPYGFGISTAVASDTTSVETQDRDQVAS